MFSESSMRNLSGTATGLFTLAGARTGTDFIQNVSHCTGTGKAAGKWLLTCPK